MTRTTKIAVGLAVVLIAVGLAVWAIDRDGTDTTTDAASSETTPTTTAPTTSTSAVPAPSTTAAPSTPVVVQTRTDVNPEQWPTIAANLPPLTLPTDCGLPLDDPASLPNSPRDYRGGVHQGIDFICEETGRQAVAALPGRVVIANNSFVDPTPAERDAVLQVANELGYTPPWTLAMLYGRHVVIDHGIIPGAGHTISIYAHFDRIDDAITPGAQIEAGTPLGVIGNTGTAPAASGADDPRSLHLHWELHLDDAYLGAGLTSDQTRDLYEGIFQ